MKIDPSTLTENDRKLILVVSDEKYQQMISKIDMKKAGAGLLGALGIGFFLMPEFTLVALVLSRLHDTSKKLGDEFIEKARKAVAVGEIPIPHFSSKEAKELFKFDIGHPIDGTAYFLNPCHDRHYLLPALANERLIQEKLAAFIEISAGLGAKQIEIVSASIESSGRKGQMGITDAASQIGLSVQVGTSGSVTRQVYMQFDKSDKIALNLPKFEPWLRTDPVLGSLVRTRQKHKARVANVGIQFDEMIQSAAKICGGYTKYGINVGGEYRAIKRSIWQFAIEFWPFEP